MRGVASNENWKIEENFVIEQFVMYTDLATP